MTETIESARLLFPLVITAAAPFGIMLCRRNQNWREAVSFAASILAFFSMLSFVPGIMRGEIYHYTLFTILPGITVSVALDGLGIVFGLVAPFLWILTTSYNVGYMRGLNEHAQTRYYTCFAIAVFGAVGIATSANVFTLYLFYEVITVFTYPLVIHHQDREGFVSGRQYLVYLMGSSKLFLLPAMALTYMLCGTLDFNFGDIVHGMFSAQIVAEHPNLVRLTYVLYIAGLAKAALMPFHNWLPSAMVAPTPVSALLHAVAVVKAGVFSVSRVILSGFGVENMDLLGLGLPTAYLAAFTIIVASLIALTKDDIKARLAYSTVSQLSYVIIGVALLTPMAVQGGLLHIANHAFSKITLFFAAGAIFVMTSQKKISLMNGLGRKMPWTFGAFAIASLSMIGIPPVCGFVTKWYLANGALQAGQVVLVGALLLSTALNAGYFVPVIYRAFFMAPVIPIDHYKEAPLPMRVPLCLTALGSVIMGIYPQIFQDFIRIFGNY